MNKKIRGLLVLALAAGLGLNIGCGVVYAEDSGESEGTAEQTQETSSGSTSISLTPVSKVLQLASNSEYKDTFTVGNDGDALMRIEVYAAPYSYVYSEASDTYQLGFNNANNFTQITRWIRFKDSDGNYVENPQFTIEPHSSLEIAYKISTPNNIPAGGQYAVIFAHTLTGTLSSNGIKTEASPGLVVYGRSTEGEAILSAEISDLKISQTAPGNGVAESSETQNVFSASAKVRNTGNVDFNASGILKVEGILSGLHYETPDNEGRASVIPEAELTVSDTWEDTPGFGLFRVTWTVTAAGETEMIEQIVFLNPVPFIIITIILLTAMIIWIIIMVRKRRERRSRLAV